MAQINDVKTNFQNNNTYWKQVADAIDYCGKDSTDGVATYGDKIKEIKNELDTEIDNLENIKSDYEADFSDINSAIISKGQTPSGGYDTYAQAILNIEGGEVTINLQEKRVEPTGDEQTVRPDSGYNGLSSVVVEAVKLQSKRVDATLVEKEVLPDSEFSGLSSIVVNPVTSDIDENIKPENIKNGISILGVNGSYIAEGGGNTPAEPVLQSKSVEPTNEVQIVTPDDGYDGLSSVEVGAIPEIELQSKEVEPLVTNQIIRADSEYTGLSDVTIKPVTASIDTNIVSSNIKKGVTILGVLGTYEAVSGGIEISDAQYICYNNSRSIDEVLPLLKDCTNYNNAFNSVVLTDGAHYIIDISKTAGINGLDQMFYAASLSSEATDGVTLEFITGQTFLTTCKMFDNFNRNGSHSVSIVFNKNNEGIVYNQLDYMFYNAGRISNIDFGNLFDNTESLSVSYMFYGIKASELNLDLDALDFSKVNNAENMFYNAEIGYISFNDLEEVVMENASCNSMFYNSNVPLDYIAFSFTNCNLTQAFSQTQSSSLKINIIGSSNDNSSYTMNNMFRNNYNLEEVTTDFDYWDIYTATSSMFENCYELYDIPKIRKRLISNSNSITSLNNMYSNCQAVEEIYIEMIFDESISFNNVSYSNVFYNDNQLVRVKGNLDMSYVSNVSNMFYNCSNLQYIETSGSFGGKSTQSNMTLDLSASSVFNATALINSLKANESGMTRIIKLHSNVLNTLTDDTKALATSKNYTLQ